MDKIAHIHLEGPLINAAEALIPEKPASLGWYKNHWAFIFNNEPSKRVFKIASKHGFTINRKDSQIVIALSGVKEYEIKKAIQKFDAFAEEYKKLSKKIASIINRSINGESHIVRTITAGYDLEKMKQGYKGKFVIHNHEADKAGKHWDVRLEFPVKSLERSLKNYDKKRPQTNEPTGKGSKDPGTVYRSFVNKLREIPTRKNKVYLIETEDHPIAYGQFEGEIKDGYGAGKVKIWDKGTFDLIYSEGDTKYILNFNGKKLKGQFALVKYKDGFLWVKTKGKDAFDHRIYGNTIQKRVLISYRLQTGI